MTSNDVLFSGEEEHFDPSPMRVIFAWLIHLITASSAVWGFMAIIAIANQQWLTAWWWMALAVLIDSFDGLLARRADVKRVVPQVDGALLDNIVDYLTYVLVPAFFLYSYGLLPPQVAALGCGLILIASGYQFSQSDAKTDDHYFKGFPSYWNVVVFYMFLLETNAWLNFGIIFFLCVMVFVPIKYIYPSRTSFQPARMLGMSMLWGVSIFAMLILYPNYPGWLMAFSFVYIIYYHIASLYLTLHKA